MFYEYLRRFLTIVFQSAFFDAACSKVVKNWYIRRFAQDCTKTRRAAIEHSVTFSKPTRLCFSHICEKFVERRVAIFSTKTAPLGKNNDDVTLLRQIRRDTFHNFRIRSSYTQYV